MGQCAQAQIGGRTLVAQADRTGKDKPEHPGKLDKPPEHPEKPEHPEHPEQPEHPEHPPHPDKPEPKPKPDDGRTYG